MSKIWQGKWIEPQQETTRKEPMFTLEEMFSGKTAPQAPVEERLLPVQFLKRVFESAPGKKIEKAQLTMTAHGIYQVKLNGQQITEALFTPDYTSYEHFLQYQTYDVTDYLAEKNVWTVLVADGWYAGRVSVNGGSAQFGDRLGILGELVITYQDGSKTVIPTDERFGSKTAEFRYSDIFIGEKQDLRLKDEDWETSCATADLTPVEVVTYPMNNLAPQSGPYVKRMAEIQPVAIWQQGDAWIVDLGQVIAGRLRLDIFLAADQQITLEHSEVLNEEGQFFHNIVGRNKDQRDIFIGRGRREVLEPQFTFHGFRYVQITGLTEPLEKAQVTGIVLYSDLKQTGYLTTDNAKVNQLLANIEWSQKGNLLSIPTDCPQRERVGWTGDMQVFAPTASFFMDVSQFIARWLTSVRLEQLPNGEVIDYSPAPSDYFNSPSLTGTNSSAGWGDAIVMVPWLLYQRYGQKAVLEENYQAMVKWHEFSKTSAAGEKTGAARYLWDTKFHFGDWMFPSFMMGPDFKGPIATSDETKEIFGTAFLAHSSQLLGEIATVLGRTEEAQGYFAYAQKVKNAFEEAYFKEGRLVRDYQGCYVIALAFELLSTANQPKALARLVTLIKDNGYRLDTGFLSVPYLLDVLVNYGESETARRVFLQEECPSWLYEVNQGATTIWESWAGIQPDGTVGNFSFNHYAFGCVGDWIVRQIAGLTTRTPGFETFYVQPNLQLGIQEFDLRYESAYGPIEIQVQKRELHLNVPENTQAYVNLTPATPETEFVVPAGSYCFPLKQEVQLVNV